MATKKTKAKKEKTNKKEKAKKIEGVSKKETTDKSFLLLQINDTLFPIGAYSHSFGLETYIQKDLVKDQDTAYEYIKRNLRASFLYNELLSAFFAYDYAIEEDYEKIIDLEKTTRAVKVAREIREASEKLGSRFIKTVNAMEVELEDDVFKNYYTKCEEEGILPNHSVAYGVFCASAGIDKKEMLSKYLYSNASGIITNCVKVVPLSQMVGQDLLTRCYPVFEELLTEVYKLTREDVGRSAPGFEIRSMQHEDLYSRLYMS